MELDSLLDTAILNRFGGLARLIGNRQFHRLTVAHVCVVGVGGVGSWIVEALARSGIGHLTLIDLDDICITNTNRQLPALTANVGRPKVVALAERIEQINPCCKVIPQCEFFTQANCAAILAQHYDYVVDAIDAPLIKALLIAESQKRKMRVVTVGAAGGKRTPTMAKIADLADSHDDSLLKRTRKLLRSEHQYPAHGRFDVPAVFSPEKPVYPWRNGEVCSTPEKSESMRLDCASGFGAATYITGMFGFVAASIVIDGLAADV